MSNAIRAIRLKIIADLAKIYLSDGQKPPEGKREERGQFGGRYYESDISSVSHQELHPTVTRQSNIYGMDAKTSPDGSVLLTARSRRNGGIGNLTKPLATKYLAKLQESFGEKFDITLTDTNGEYQIAMTPKQEKTSIYPWESNPQFSPYKVLLKVESADDIKPFVYGVFKDKPLEVRDQMVSAIQKELSHQFGRSTYYVRRAIMNAVNKFDAYFPTPFEKTVPISDGFELRVRDPGLGTSPPEAVANMPGYYDDTYFGNTETIPLSTEERDLIMAGRGKEVAKRLEQERDAGHARCSACGKLVKRDQISFHPDKLPKHVGPECVAKYTRQPRPPRQSRFKYTGD